MIPRRALLAALLSACAASAHAGSVLDAIRARGTLRVGTTGDYKPFTFREPDGSLHGADIDMARRLADSLGVKVEFVPAVWATINDDFAAGKFDVAMGGITILPARSATGAFTRPVFVDGKRPIARCADAGRFTSIAAINRPEVRVVVNPGAANEQFARANFPAATLTVHRDNASVFQEIRDNRADVMVTDGIEVDHQAHIHPDLCPAKVPAPFTRLEKAYWVQRDPELITATSAWLDQEMTTGGWERTLKQALEGK